MTRLVENAQIAAAILPVNLATAVNNGDWVSLKNYGHVAIVVIKDGGTAAEDPSFTVRQATDVAGTGAKALNFTRVDKKQAADVQTVAQFTKVTQAASNTYAGDGTSAEDEMIVVIEFDADELDTENGFDCVQLQIPDVGAAAQLAAAIYILTEPRYGQEPALGAIAD